MMRVLPTHPWHNTAFKQLWGMQTQNRLPGALLIDGIQNIGKLTLAIEFITALLCLNLNNTQTACGTCASCLALSKDDLSDKASQKEMLIRQSHHDSVIYCRKELNKQGKLSEMVRIDQVRAFCNALYKTSQSTKIGLLWYGDELNAESADSLLKTLEEPPKNTTIIILAHQKSNLPATILSRTQCVNIEPNQTQLALDWLVQKSTLELSVLKSLLLASHGAPLAVLKMINNNQHTQYQDWRTYLLNIANQADQVTQEKPDTSHQGLILGLSCLGDLLRQIIKQQSNNATEEAVLDNIANKAQARFLFALLDDVGRAIQLSHTPINLGLLLDNILIIWSHITRLAHYPKLTY